MNVDIARIDQTVRAMAAELASMPDPNWEPRPAARVLLTEQRRLLQAQLDEISITRSSTAKFMARIAQLQDTRANTMRACADFEAAAFAAPEGDVKRAYQLGWDVLTGKVGGMPLSESGACIEWCRTHGVARLMPLPMCDAMLAEAEADLQPILEHLLGALDAWDAAALVVATATVQSHATSDITLPSVEVHGELHVRERR